MKLLTIIAVLLVGATPASARFAMNWECGPDKVEVTLTFLKPHQWEGHYLSHGIEIAGLRDPVKDRVTFKEVTKEGYLRAYLNGKPCKEIPYPAAGDSAPQLTDDDKRALALHPGVPILPPPEYDRPHLLINWLDGPTHEELVAYCDDPKARWLLQVGCAKPDGHPCKIYLAREETITAAGLTLNLVKRHMIGRCNGWPDDHTGAR
jgi:hypothetical protein